jgi:hypothetical protein
MRLAGALGATVALLLCAASASAATTWYVDANQNFADCTQAKPCQTINEAVTKATDGDTIEIAAGLYTDSIATPKRLTFDGVGREIFVHPTTFVRGTASGSPFALSNGGTIRDMVVAGATPASSEANATALSLTTPAGAGAASAYTLTNITATAGTTAGQPGRALDATPAGRPITVHASDSSFVGKPGFHSTVRLNGSPTVSTGNALRLDGTNVSGDGAGVGIEVFDADLTFNLGTANGLSAVDVGGHTTTSLRRVRAEGGASGLTARGPATVTVRDSLLATDGTTSNAAGIEADDAFAPAGPQLTLVGSTVVARGPSPSGGLSILGESSTGVDATAVDTIFRAIPTDAGPEYDVAAAVVSNGTATLHASHSAYSTVYNSGATVSPAGSGTNVAAAPLFTDPANGDYTLKPGSPLVDRGDPSAVHPGEVDLAGHARALDGNGDCARTPDIGAFERPAFTPAPSCVPKDTIAPVLTKVRFKPRKLRAGRRGKLSLRLSEKAKLTVAVQKRKHGKVRAFAKLVRAGAGPGPVKLKIGPKVAGKKLRVGRYRLRLRAVDAAGNRSKVRSISFRLARSH